MAAATRNVPILSTMSTDDLRTLCSCGLGAPERARARIAPVFLSDPRGLFRGGGIPDCQYFAAVHAVLVLLELRDASSPYSSTLSTDERPRRLQFHVPTSSHIPRRMHSKPYADSFDHFLKAGDSVESLNVLARLSSPHHTDGTPAHSLELITRGYVVPAMTIMGNHLYTRAPDDQQLTSQHERNGPSMPAALALARDPRRRAAWTLVGRCSAMRSPDDSSHDCLCDSAACHSTSRVSGLQGSLGAIDHHRAELNGRERQLYNYALHPPLMATTISILQIAIDARTLFDNGRIAPASLAALYKAYNPTVRNPTLFAQRAIGIFPKLNCGLASAYLRRAIGRGIIVRGYYATHSHTFLLVDNNTIVDITADQYGGPRIYVGRLTYPWTLRT